MRHNISEQADFLFAQNYVEQFKSCLLDEAEGHILYALNNGGHRHSWRLHGPFAYISRRDADFLGLTEVMLKRSCGFEGMFIVPYIDWL